MSTWTLVTALPAPLWPSTIGLSPMLSQGHVEVPLRLLAWTGWRCQDNCQHDCCVVDVFVWGMTPVAIKGGGHVPWPAVKMQCAVARRWYGSDSAASLFWWLVHPNRSHVHPCLPSKDLTQLSLPTYCHQHSNNSDTSHLITIKDTPNPLFKHFSNWHYRHLTLNNTLALLICPTPSFHFPP